MSTERGRMIGREQRANLVTARETVRRAAKGEDNVDLAAAADLLDRVLESTCPHDPSNWINGPDESGRQIITCLECGVSWFR